MNGFVRRAASRQSNGNEDSFSTPTPRSARVSRVMTYLPEVLGFLHVRVLERHVLAHGHDGVFVAHRTRLIPPWCFARTADLPGRSRPRTECRASVGAGHAWRGARRRAQECGHRGGEHRRVKNSSGFFDRHESTVQTGIRGILLLTTVARNMHKRHSSSAFRRTRPARGEAHVSFSDRSGARRDPSACPLSASRARSPVRR